MTQRTPWDPETRKDPHSFWNAVRDTAPVHVFVGPETGTNYHMITGFEEVATALRHPSIGHEWQKHMDREEVEFETGADDGPFAALGRNMLFLDPPDHTRLRGLVRDAFSKRTVDRLEDRVRSYAHELLDAVEDVDSFDLVESFALPIPVTIIAELLGVPAEDQPRFREWTKVILGTDFEAAQLAGMHFVQYFNELAEERRSHPQDDLVSYLLTVEEEGERLDHMEFLGMVFLLLVAGHETTVNLIANGTLELTRHPDQRARLVEDRSLLRTGVEEMLRWHGPVESTTLRIAFEDVEIGGVTISRGAPVIPILFGANRDPRKFEDPETFDVGRQRNPHMAFGFGIHSCLGAPLARMEAIAAFDVLFERTGGLALAMDESDLDWPKGFFLRGPQRLEVTAA
jgi:cytochrome P450 PksS